MLHTECDQDQPRNFQGLVQKKMVVGEEDCSNIINNFILATAEHYTKRGESSDQEALTVIGSSVIELRFRHPSASKTHPESVLMKSLGWDSCCSL